MCPSLGLLKKGNFTSVFLPLCRNSQNNYGKLWDFRDFDFTTMVYDSGKQAKKQGDQEWSPNFMVKNGQK